MLTFIRCDRLNREISTTLHLSIGTVKNYVSQILHKLEMRDRIAAALWAKENLE